MTNLIDDPGTFDARAYIDAELTNMLRRKLAEADVAFEESIINGDDDAPARGVLHKQ